MTSRVWHPSNGFAVEIRNKYEMRNWKLEIGRAAYRVLRSLCFLYSLPAKNEELAPNGKSGAMCQEWSLTEVGRAILPVLLRKPSGLKVDNKPRSFHLVLGAPGSAIGSIYASAVAKKTWLFRKSRF